MAIRIFGAAVCAIKTKCASAGSSTYRDVAWAGAGETAGVL